MAVTRTIVCDFGQGSCKQPATSYRLWRDGDRQALAIDLCDVHARPLLDAIAGAAMVELPSKPRVKMTATRLRTTPETRQFKK